MIVGRLTYGAYIDGSARRHSRNRSHLPDNRSGIRALRRSRRVAIEAPFEGVNGRGALLGHLEPVGLEGTPCPHHGLVLGLGPPQGRLHRHDSLSLRREAALLALARAVLAVPLVALEGDLHAVVAAPRAVRGRPGGGRGARRVHVHLRVEVLFGGHGPIP